MKFQQITILTFLSVFNFAVNAAEFDAEINWADIRQLGVPISGQVNKVTTSAGSYVKSGDTMLSISCDIYKAKLEQSKAVVAGLSPAVETALKEKELADELFDRTVLSEVEHRQAELVYIETKAKYDSHQAQAKQEKIRVGFCDLKAERSLLVLKVHVMTGEMYSLESQKPVLLTVASRNSMAATAKLVLPLKQVYRVGQAVNVSVAGKKYKGRIQALNYLNNKDVSVNVTFDAFDPRLIGNNTAKIIVQ